MFDEFGNFDSVDQINEKAEELANTGNKEALIRLAKENGIAAEIADLYMDGEIEVLADVTEAAVGKLEMERQETVLEGVLEDWIAYIEAECMEDEQMAIAVRRKKKSLNGCIAVLLLESMLKQKQVDKPILDEVERLIVKRGINVKKDCGIEKQWLKYTKLGFPGSGRAKEIIRDYYLGGE